MGRPAFNLGKPVPIAHRQDKLVQRRVAKQTSDLKSVIASRGGKVDGHQRCQGDLLRTKPYAQTAIDHRRVNFASTASQTTWGANVSAKFICRTTSREMAL